MAVVSSRSVGKKPVLNPIANHISAVKFGLFEVDLTRSTLSRQGVRIKLQEQPFRILALLLQHNGEIVKREQLRQALWPEGTHVNFEGSLNAALKKLRAALQDDAENPRFIETVPRQGYRFLAPVHVMNDSVPSVPQGQFALPLNGGKAVEVRLQLHPEFSPEVAAELYWDRKRAERTQRWFDSMLLMVAIVFGSWLLFFIVYPVPRPSVQRIRRITNAGRIDEWGGIVSDGTRIFFLEHDGGHWNLMQTSVEGGGAEKLAAPFENTRLFAISPDHSEFVIGRFARHDDEMPLWLWPVQGGEPTRLGQAVGHDPAWSPDGTQIAFVREQSLYSIHRDGTQLREFVHVEGRPRAPAWSPDAQHIRVTIDLGEYGAQSLWEMSADGSGGLHPILANGTPSRQTNGSWTADGKYFLFSGCERYDCNLWAIRDTWSWFRRSQHGPFPLTSGPGSLHVAIPAQTGSRIFAFSFRSHRELAEMEPRTSRFSTLSVDANVEEASVSPDGQMVAYFDRPDGSLWRSRRDGSQRVRLTNAPLQGVSPRWSAKGEQILFTGARTGQARQIYVASWDGGSLRPVLPKGWEGLNADWSPDGYRMVVAMRNQKAHPQYAMYLLEPTTGFLKELPDSKDLIEPRWSPSGRYIAALDNSKHRLSLYDVSKGEWSEIASGGLLQAPHWSPDSTAIYFQDQLDDKESVFRADVLTHRVDRVLGFESFLRGSATHCLFSGVGHDGSIYVMIERGVTDIYALDLDLP
jgi:Tol biopolymer transport system component/DNA-binding winged helix-turn-helix (wHTH) protein